jgi:hypothetical protein
MVVVGRLGVAVAIPLVVVSLFVAAAFGAERFREGVGRLAPYMPLLLYAAVGVLLAWQLATRFVRGDITRWSSSFVAAPLALAGAVVAYLVPLVDRWENGRRAYASVAGVLPYSDARGYYIGAQQLLFDGDLDSFNSRRPLNAAFLTFRLAVTNLDLRWSLVIQAVLLGVASFLAARVVARDLGPVAGMALFAGIYGFAAFGVDTVMSESLGVTLGALALAALWTAVRDRRLWVAAVGLFLLTSGMNARAGAFLLLLALPIFLAWRFRRSERFSWKTLGVTLGAVVAALATNVFLVVLLHGAPSNLNTNFNQSLYGLARGNERWTQIY